MEYFRELDIFYSTDFKFSVFKKSSFKTHLGAILSIITLALTVIITFYFGKDLYYRTNPKLVYNEIVPQNYPAFNVTKDNFLLYYQLQDGNGLPIPTEPNLYFHTYYFQANVLKGVGNPIIYKTTYINSTSCDLSLVGNATYFNLKKMNQFKCLNLTNTDSQKKGYEIGGYWDGDFLNYFYMELSFCQNLTDDYKGINCTNTQQIEDFLYQGGSQTTMNMFVQSGYVANDILTQPLKTDYSVYFNDLNLNSRNKATFFFEQMKLQDDIGIMLPEEEDSSLFSLKKESVINSHIKEINATNNYFDSVLFSTAIYFTKTSSEYKRYFMKLQDLTAQVGGFVNGILIILQFFMKFFQKVEIKKIIINNIFDVNKSSTIKDNHDILKRIHLSSSKRYQATNLPSFLKERSENEVNNNKLQLPIEGKSDESNSINNIHGGNESKLIIEKRKEFQSSPSMEMIEKNVTQFDIPYLILIKKACCEKFLNDENLKTLSLVKYANDYIEEKLDIEHYLKQCIKFEYLLKLFLSKEERLLFKNMKKPPLKLPKKDIIIEHQIKQKITKFEEFFRNNNNTDTLNRKMSIVKSLNPTVLDYISKDFIQLKKNHDISINSVK